MLDSLLSPLHGVHEAAGAVFQLYDQTPIVSTFGAPELEYAALHKSAGLMDLPQRGLIEVGGPDRLSFLNNLLTNQTSGLRAGQGVYAFLLKPNGRIICDCRVLETPQRTLLELDGRIVPAVMQELEKYRFAEKVQIHSQVGRLHELGIYGPQALAMVNAQLEQPIEPMPVLGSTGARICGHEVTLWSDDVTGSPGYQLLVPFDAAAEIWQGLMGWGARPVGWAAFNAARIEAGRPLFGIDFDPSVLPAETGLLERAVSFSKGCYVGQEIVARMHTRDQLARQLVGIRMDEDALPISGAQIADQEGNPIGGVTSSTISPVLSGAAIALGYVKRHWTQPGTALRVAAEGGMRSGHVVGLPFINPG